MINLIPPKGKSVALREYWIRVVSVWALLISSVALMSTFLLLPTYVLIRSQLSALQEEVLQQSNAEESFKTAQDLVREANITATQLAKPGVGVFSHEVIRTITDAAGPNIELNSFRLPREGKKIDAVTIQGTAKTREALAQFKTSLEQSAHFETAAVPISDLARETDLPFAITVEMASAANE